MMTAARVVLARRLPPASQALLEAAKECVPSALLLAVWRG